MGLFNFKKKNDEDVQQEAPARNPSNILMFRLLAIGYVLYLAWESVKAYREGGEGVPDLWVVILSVVLLVGGAAFLGWITFKEYKRNQAKSGGSRYEDEEDLEEDDRYEDDDDLYEDEFDDEESEEE